MTNPASGAPIDAPSGPARPTTLVVVGAAAGMGRWLTDHLLLDRHWERIVLVDTPDAAGTIAPSDPATTVVAAGEPIGVDAAGCAVVLAVPREAVAGVMAWLTPMLAPDAMICVVSANQATTLTVVAEHWPAGQVFGLHPLFDSSARSAEGQTFLIVGEAERDVTAGWLADLIALGGGISDSGSAADHDAIMGYVQTMTHQALIAFADAVTSSGLDLEHVWEARTPLFEGLFGLAVRALTERQQATIADIQLSMDGPGAAGELGAATARVREVVDGASPVAIEAMIAGIRDRFSGGLFEPIQATAVSAVTATQAKRAELARHRRLGSLVGVRPIGRPQALRVGHIAEVTPVSVTLREVMVGKAGSATLLEGAGRRNAGRVGMNGTPSLTVFGLGHIDVVLGDELEAALDEWLAFIRRDVRFLVPESVAGVGVLTIVSSHAGVRDAEVVSEVVRTGQRSVVVRVFIRADHDVEDTVEALRAQVQATYRWPQGLSLAAPDVQRVHHLGPAGTFSEAAARQATGSLGITAGLVPEPDFTGVLNAIGDGVLGVLPISSSASGLVTRSVTALLDHPSDLVAGGVVDVAVRFDAYVQESRQLTDLRGAKVFSHPQALGQCQAFIRRWGLDPVPCPSTAEALTMVAADPEGSVALAVADSEAPGLKIAEREVDDLSGSITRFLILGTSGAFGDMTGGWDPTLRSLWVADSVATVLDMIEPGSPAFDELLTDGDGRCLWVTSRRFDDGAPAGARYLGRAPWSPRTPVVRVEVDVPRDRA